MDKTIKVTIGGKNYSLKGNNEEMVQQIAENVNKELFELKEVYNKEPESTLSVLAALNIAEKSYNNNLQKTVDQSIIVSELNKMAEHLEKCL